MPTLSQQFLFAIYPSTTATSVSIPSAAFSSDGNTLFKSKKEKGDGYYGGTAGVHTVTYTVTPSFVGTLTMQASLATDPIEADWFDIDNTKITYDQLVNPIATTTTNYVNFVGNFVWVRAKVFKTTEPTIGSVSFINYNH